MPAPVREDWAELECNGVTIDAWTSYSVESDLFTAADQCRLHIGVGTSKARDLRANIDRLKSLLAPGGTVKLWISARGKRALQGVFVIDSYEIANDADGGTQFSVEARDLARHLIANVADPKLYHASDTLVSVAKRAVSEWGIEVTADHVGARDLRQARVTKDKLARLRAKARAWGLPPSTMSEKIASSIEKGTITFDEFRNAYAGATVNVTQFSGQGALPGYAKPDSVAVSRIPPLQRTWTDADGTHSVAGTFPYRQTFIGIPYSGEAGISSLKIYQLRVADIRPQDGETIWEFLDRSAKRNGLLMSMSPDGKLVFCGMHYDQEPSYSIIRRIADGSQNNIVSGSMRLDISNVYSDVLVYGRAKGKGSARTKLKGHATTKPNEESYMPFRTSTTIRDNSIKTKEDAQKRAEYELAKSKQSAMVLSYSVFGHSQNGLIWAADTVVDVQDEVTGVFGAFYITARTFTRSAKQAPMTELKLVRKGAIVLSMEGNADG